MATSEFWQRISSTVTQPRDWPGYVSENRSRNFQSRATLWILLDVSTVSLAAVVATIYETHTGPLNGAREFYRGTLFQGRSMGMLLVFLCGFTVAIIATS